jgi:hypothetical protein
MSFSQRAEHILDRSILHPIELDTNRLQDQKLENIHNNPVEAGWVDDPGSYIYSRTNTRSSLFSEAYFLKRRLACFSNTEIDFTL